MLSGPEPQRSVLEKRLRAQLSGFGGRALVALGRPSLSPEHEVDGRVTYVSHLDADRMHAAILSAKSIVCRGGYTTIMELASLGRTAVLIPTPGQSEQEYLCEYLAAQQKCVWRTQDRFNLIEALGALDALPTLVPVDSAGLLDSAVQGLERRT